MTVRGIGRPRAWEPDEMFLLCYAGARMGDAERTREGIYGDSWLLREAPRTPRADHLRRQAVREIPIEVKRAKIRELYRAKPFRAAESIAREVGTNHYTVREERERLIAAGEIPPKPNQ